MASSPQPSVAGGGVWFWARVGLKLASRMEDTMPIFLGILGALAVAFI
jgi:hypothetical protein